MKAHTYMRVLFYKRHTLVPQCQLVKGKCSLQTVQRISAHPTPGCKHEPQVTHMHAQSYNMSTVLYIVIVLEITLSYNTDWDIRTGVDRAQWREYTSGPCTDTAVPNAPSQF